MDISNIGEQYGPLGLAVTAMIGWLRKLERSKGALNTKITLLQAEVTNSEKRINELEDEVSKIETKSELMDSKLFQKLETLIQAVARLEGRLDERFK